MSHYTVLVRVTPERLARHAGGEQIDGIAVPGLHDALAEMLAPYKECPPDESPHRQFKIEATRAEAERRYREERVERVRLPDGSTVWPHDSRFRVGEFPNDRIEPPKDQLGEVPISEIYKTLAEYAEDYQGWTQHEGAYGYWHNPNAKWDWWVVGGRWAGQFPIKAGEAALVRRGGYPNVRAKRDHADVATVREIDFDAVAVEHAARYAKFEAEWVDFLAGKEFNVWDGPRTSALAVGLVRTVSMTDAAEVASVKPSEILRPWIGHAAERKRADVLRPLAGEELRAIAWEYFNPIRTYAALDDEGWHAPGEMGWWGCSSDTTTDKLEWCRTFMEKHIRPDRDQSDLLVVVDCHI